MPRPLLFVLDSFSGANAGTESQIVLLLRSLDRTRFAPRVALLRGPNLLGAHLPDVPVEVLEVRQIRSLRSWWQAWRYARRAASEGAKVAQLFFNDASVIFPLPLRLAGIRVVTARRDLGFWYTPSLLRLLRFSGRFVDAVVCNAHAVRDVVIEHEGIPAQRVTVIHNGLARTSAAVGSSDPISSLHIPAHTPLLAIVANLRPLKRIDTAIRALARLSHLTRPPQLIVAGADRAGRQGDSHRAELAALAEQLGVRERVHFIGPVEDPMPLLQRCDVALLCSETEGLSNSVIEYLLAGKPVFCTPVGGNRELVEEGQTGYFFEVGDDMTLAAKIARLVDDERLLRAMSAQAAADARSRFDAKRMTAAYELLYTHLAQSTAGRGSRLPELPVRAGEYHGQ